MVELLVILWQRHSKKKIKNYFKVEQNRELSELFEILLDNYNARHVTNAYITAIVTYAHC